MNEYTDNFTNKNLLIAGGTDGIGFAFLKVSLTHNYRKIYVLGRNFKKLEKINDNRIQKLQCDITNSDKLSKLIQQLETIDIFVNTIGTFTQNQVEKIKEEDIVSHFNTNVIANVNITRLILEKLNNNFSQILVCLATLALEAQERFSLQSSTKAAYKFFLDSLRKEVSDRIRVMTILPPSTKTDIFKKAGDLRKLTKYAEPKQIATVMDFMLSQPSNITIPEVAIMNRNSKR